MSYEIIKGFKVNTDGEVWIKSASNNVVPKNYKWWHCESLTRILNDKGREALDIEVLNEYYNGNFQAGTKNKYTRAMDYLHYAENMIPYRDFGNLKYEDRIPYYKKALKTETPKDKFILRRKSFYGDYVYLIKESKRGSKWGSNKDKAKVFKYRREAEFRKKMYMNGENWEVEKLSN